MVPCWHKVAYVGNSRGSQGKSEEQEQTDGTRRGVLPEMRLNQRFLGIRLTHLWSVWECRACGYRGAFILRDGKLADKLRENFLRKSSKC